MTTFFDFINLVREEVASLMDIVPPYISTIFVAGATFSIVLALKRAIL